MNYLQKKKLAFMSIVNSVKGFIRSITGVFPLALPNCVDSKSIIDYTIYGASGGVGEYDETSGKYKIPITLSGKNLFDVSKITGGIGVVEYNGVQCFKYADVAANKYGTFTYTDAFKENTRYTFAIKVYDEDANKSTAIKFTYTDGTTYSLQIAKMNTVYKYTTTAGKTLQSFTNTHSWGINRYIDLTATQLEEGTSSTECEPYHEPITTNIYLGEPLSEGQSINYKKDRLPTLPTVKGTSILNADTTIQPSNAEVTYYSTLKG